MLSGSVDETDSKFEAKCSKAVVDTSALIKAPLDEICKFAEVLYTVQEVVLELKDKKTRNKLAFVPNYLKIVVPNEESFQFVCDFSKEAGCYPALSIADLKVIALCHQLHVERYGAEKLNKKPKERITVSNPTPEAVSDSDKVVIHKDDSKIPGFYEPSDEVPLSETELITEFQNIQVESKDGNDDNDTKSYESEDIDDSDTDSGWITQSNLKDAQKRMEMFHFKDQEEEYEDDIACVTLDYAMQRVLQQIGLIVMSVDGIKMGQLRSYVLKCYSCNNKTTEVTKVFCPNCGLKTLLKLYYSLDEEGSIVYHYSKNFKVNKRGQKYNVPKAQGGKHGQNPWVAEDQRFPKNQAPKKSRLRNLPLEPDYIANSSPFLTRDTHSRYFNHGLGCLPKQKWMQRNPNENLSGAGTRRKKNKP